jgi:hypothetical protein
MMEDRDPDPDPEFDPDLEAIIEDDGTISDDTRHYQQDPDFEGTARDADEQEQDDVLDLDQAELDELGLTLDDPHQPESD